MSREEQIMAALIELSVTSKLVNLEKIRLIVKRNEREQLPRSWRQTAGHVLRTLSGLGLVEACRGSDGRLTYDSVTLTNEFFATSAVEAFHANHQRAEEGTQGNPSRRIPARGRQLVGRDENVQKRHGGGDGDDGRNGGGGGGGDGDNGDGPRGGNGAGDGFREVLAHPYLFSLDEATFNNILDEI